MSKFWHFFDEIFYVIWHLKLLGGCQFQKHPLQCTVYILRPLPPHLDNGLDLGLEALRRLQQPSNCWTRVFPMLKHTTQCSVWLIGGKKKTWKSSNNGFQSSWSSERGTRYFFFKSAESTWKTDVVYRGMPRQSRHAYLCKLVQNMGVNILGGEKAKHNLGGQMCWFVMCNYLIQWLIKGCSILAWSWPDNCFFSLSIV